MPSSPIRTLPRPSTSVFTGSFVTLLPVKLPSANDRGYRTTALDVIVIEGEIYVNNNKCDEEPQEQVVPEAYPEFTAHQRHNPGKHPRQPRVAHAGVEGETRDGLEDKQIGIPAW